MAAGLDLTFVALAVVAAFGVIVAMQLWPRDYSDAPEHPWYDAMR